MKKSYRQIKLRLPESKAYKFDFVTMSDIAFNLLTFTMLSLSSKEQNIINVDAPKSSVNAKESSEFILTIDCNRKLYLKNVEVSLTELYSKLQGSTKEDKNTLIIHADKSVPIDLIVKVGEIAIDSNMKIAIATVENDNK